MRRAPTVLATLIAMSCAVSRPGEIDNAIFSCGNDAECGPGQACAEGNVYSVDFCRPACDPAVPSSCNGVCTARGACLERCTISSDGQPSQCSSSELTCVRTDAVRNEGVCYPVQSCSRNSDCTGGSVAQQCLNEALGLPATTGGTDARFDNLYCTASPDSNSRCPQGYLSFEVTTPTGPRAICYAPCSLEPAGPHCPPATVCFRGAGELVGAINTPPCLTGVFGLPCLDDTQCLLGRCLDVGGGHRACTETCADAELYGGCEQLEGYSEYVSATARIRCEPVGDQMICVPRFDLLSVCSDQLECIAGTPCERVTAGTRIIHVCLRTCTSAEQCVDGTGGTAADYRCLDTGLCMRKLAAGSRCADALDCRSGRCETVDGVQICVSG